MSKRKNVQCFKKILKKMFKKILYKFLKTLKVLENEARDLHYTVIHGLHSIKNENFTANISP